jgi:hypothetical protein
MATQDHNYTLTPHSYERLLQLTGQAQPSKATAQRRGPEYTISATGQPTQSALNTERRPEGLSFALRELAIQYDPQEWTPRPDKYTGLYYTPLDLDYMRAASEDDTPFSDLPNWEQQERTLQLSLRRFTDARKPTRYSPSRYSLSLPSFVREYYASFLIIHSIPLPKFVRHPNNLTTQVSWVLEAIGSGHLTPPDGYLEYTTRANPRKRRIVSAERARKLYGNFAGTPYLRAKDDKWRPIPPLNTPDAHLSYTQEDIDACYKQDLRDIAQEILALRPDLHEPTLAGPPWPSRPTPPVRQPLQATATGALRRRLQHAQQTLVTKPQYLYKGRDVTGAVDEALQAPPQAHMSIATDYGLPLYILKRLATRERVRQEVAVSHGND